MNCLFGYNGFFVTQKMGVKVPEISVELVPKQFPQGCRIISFTILFPDRSTYNSVVKEFRKVSGKYGILILETKFRPGWTLYYDVEFDAAKIKKQFTKGELFAILRFKQKASSFSFCGDKNFIPHFSTAHTKTRCIPRKLLLAYPSIFA